MKVRKTKDRAMLAQGFNAYVQWNDKSKSYYRTKQIAISEMRKEIAGKRGEK